MNYVAHLFLSRPTDEHRIGSLLADFTVGRLSSLRERYSRDIVAGIAHHRAVDQFTDTHPAVAAAIDLLKGAFGLYSGIVVDVIYDHFLLRHWPRFAALPMEPFFDAVYRSLARNDWPYPPRYAQVIQRMLEKRWLSSYLDLGTVAFALKRVGERFDRPTPLADTLPGMRASYGALEESFLLFFPELVVFSSGFGTGHYKASLLADRGDALLGTG